MQINDSFVKKNNGSRYGNAFFLHYDQICKIPVNCLTKNGVCSIIKFNNFFVQKVFYPRILRKKERNYRNEFF